MNDDQQIVNALKKSEALYREAQEIARLGHWELDLRTNELVWSDEIYRIFDIDPHEFAASYETFISLIHPDDREFVDRAYKTSLEKQTIYDVIHRLKMKDGSVKYVHERGQSQWDDRGTPLRSFGTVQDITALKKAEIAREQAEGQLRQAQKLDAIGTLAGGIAHDFNNILFAVLGYTEMSLELADPGSILSKNLEKIYEAGSRARDLVNQILTFCRNTAEEKNPVEIRMIIKEVLRMIRATLPSTIRIHQNLGSAEKVMADSGQIHQVVMNLCTNAACAMGSSDTGVLTVELEDMDMDDLSAKRFINLPAGRYIKLAVSDTGVGISPDIKERIFDPFFTTKGDGGGTGLGLSVVHGIVKNHGGRILVYSEPGMGTTFKVFLPVINAPDERPDMEEKPLPGGTEHILVVDDEPMIADVMEAMLLTLGYTVETVVDSTLALSRFTANHQAFDLLITDMTMPSMNGLRLAEKVLAIEPELPVIITTGFSEKISDILIQQSGIRSILFKPIVKKNLALAVRNVLGTRHCQPQVDTDYPD